MLSLDPNNASIEEALMEASSKLPSYRWLKGQVLGMAYRYRRQLPLFYDNRTGTGFTYDPNPEIDRVSQIGLFTRFKLGSRWNFDYAFSYSLAGELLLQNRGGVAYTSACRCWKIAVEVRQDRQRGLEARIGFTLLGIGDGAGAGSANPLFR